MVGLIKKEATTVAEKIESDQEMQTRLREENSAVMRNIAEATDIVESNRQTQSIELTGIKDFY